MCISLNKEKPENIASYMINWLKDKYNISSSLLKNDEKKELENLKNEVHNFHEMDEHFFFIESQLKAKKETKVVEKKSKAPPKLKPRLPPDEIIPSDDEDINNPDEIDKRLDDPEYIESNIRQERRPGALEIFGQNAQNIKIKYNKKPPEIFEFIKINLLKSPLFSDLSFDVLKKCIDAMEEKNYSAMSEIVKQGDFSDLFYFIFEGELECKMGFTIVTREGNTKKEEKFDPRLVKVYYPGDYFGELNLLFHSPIRGTVKCITEAKIFILDRKIYKELLSNSLKEKNENRVLLFKSVPILETLEEQEFERLTRIVKEAIFYKGDIIIKENEYCNMLMIIEEGNCVGKKIKEKGKLPQKTKDYRENYIFFQESLLKSEKSQESIIAGSDVVKLICIDRYTFNNIFGSLEQILMRKPEVYQKYFPPLPEIVEEKPNLPPILFEGENLNPDNMIPMNENNLNNIEPQNINNNEEQHNIINQNNEQENINNINPSNIAELTEKYNKEKEEMKKEYEKKLKELDEKINSLKSPKINDINNNNNINNINNQIEYNNKMISINENENMNLNNDNMNNSQNINNKNENNINNTQNINNDNFNNNTQTKDNFINSQNNDNFNNNSQTKDNLNNNNLNNDNLNNNIQNNDNLNNNTQTNDNFINSQNNDIFHDNSQNKEILNNSIQKNENNIENNDNVNNNFNSNQNNIIYTNNINEINSNTNKNNENNILESLNNNSNNNNEVVNDRKENIPEFLQDNNKNGSGISPGENNKQINEYQNNLNNQIKENNEIIQDSIVKYGEEGGFIQDD